jgi:branched-chain amino acid transport system ATP-binding protein
VSALLEVREVTRRFGGLTAVKDVAFAVEEGGLFGVIGPNGAGKTTLFNLITGIYAPDTGTVALDGATVSGLPPHRIAAHGIARTFQNIRLVGDLSVLDNVKIACHMKRAASLAATILRTAAFRRSEEELEAFAKRLLDLLGLSALAEEEASSLPYGLQRRLEIARALATEPRLLLLDEPAAGMNPQEALDLMALIRRLRDEFRLTILLVEHNRGDGRLRAHPRARPRREPRRGHTGGDPAQPEGDRSLPGGRVMLEIRSLTCRYGGVRALDGLNLHVEAGEVVTLIGANGAGKSTTLRAVAGLVPPASGDVLFEGKSIAKLPPHKIAALGIALVPEGRAIFANLTVRENLEMGGYLRPRREFAAGMEHAFSLFPRLQERIGQSAGTLSGGEQQMLAIGRALMAKPRLLLLDEPSLGIAPLLVKAIYAGIDAVSREGVTVLVVEQNAHIALRHSRRAYVLETGRIAMEGPSAQLADDPRVKGAYLGETEKG